MSSIKKTQHKSNNKSYKSSNKIEGLKDLNTNLDKISNQSKPVSKISEKSISITISKAAASPFPSSYFFTNDQILENSTNGILKKSNDLDYVSIKGNTIKEIKGITKVFGTLNIDSASLNSFGDLEEIRGSLWLSKNTIHKPNLESLGKIKKITGDLSSNLSLNDLGELAYVGGDLKLNDSSIENLSKLKYVGKNLTLPKRLKDTIDIKNIDVKGEIRFRVPYKKVDYLARNKNLVKIESIPFWQPQYIYSYSAIFEAEEEQRNFYFNVFKPSLLKKIPIDLCGIDNYAFILFFDIINNINDFKKDIFDLLDVLNDAYPFLKSYSDNLLVEKLEEEGNYQLAWYRMITSNNHIGIEKILMYSSKLNDFLITPKLALRLVGNPSLTFFGLQNIDEICKIFKSHLDTKIKTEANNDFWSLFLKSKNPLKAYPEEHYKKFFISKGSHKAEDRYNFYKSIDKDQKRQYKFNILENGAFPHLIEKSILDYLRNTFIESENIFRVENGISKIGEGSRWKTEKELFDLIKTEFSDLNVVYQASPDWLGRQSFDVYIPEKNIALEYQGQQHYEPIDFFGGDEGLKKTKERDFKKQSLSKENDCLLFIVDQGYSYELLLSELKSAIEIRQNKNFSPDFKIRKTSNKPKGKVIKIEGEFAIYDCKTQKQISLKEIESIENKKIKPEYFLKQDGVFGRYVLDKNKETTKTHNSWKNILNIETNEIERHNMKSFSEKLKIKPNNVWNFFNGKQKKFQKKYEIVN